MNKQLQKAYAEKWEISEEAVYTVFKMIHESGGKYGKTSRALKGFKILISPRQLRYFYKKVKLFDRMDIETKGRPEGYSELLRKKT